MSALLLLSPWRIAAGIFALATIAWLAVRLLSIGQ
jgi:hypothetical protein